MAKITYPNGSTPSICIVGAGFSGLLAGIQLQRLLGLKTFTIFDQNEDVGGTWFINKYPGAGADVMSLVYSYSFDPNLQTKSNYSTQEEIHKYLVSMANKYDLYSNIKFSVEVRSMTWDENLRKWRVEIYKIKTGETEELIFDIAFGYFGVFKNPNFPESFRNFKRPCIHSARWDSTVDLNDKIVGIVGSGATAAQLIPAIAHKVKCLHSYQRNPSWIGPRFEFQTPAIIQWVLVHIPFLMFLYNWLLFLLYDFFQPVFKKGTVLGKLCQFVSNAKRKWEVKDKEIVDALLPSYSIGCRHIILSDTYLPAISRPNVVLHRNPILEVGETSIRTCAGEQALDVLILATGFVTQDPFAPLKLIGKHSIDILAEWKSSRPTSYLGITNSLLPNYFMLMGPNTRVGHSGLVFMMECQVSHVIELLKQMMAQNSTVIEVRESAEMEFQNELDEGLKKTIYYHKECNSFFINENGHIVTEWPYYCMTYWRRTRRPNFKNYKFS